MDEQLRKALDELEAAEAEMATADEFMDPDPEDRLYTAACHVAQIWANLKKLPEIDKQAPIQTGVSFSLGEDGKTKISPVYKAPFPELD